MTDPILVTTAQITEHLRATNLHRDQATIRTWAHRFPMQMPSAGRLGRQALYRMPDALRTCRAVEAEQATYVEWLLTVWDCQTRAVALVDHLRRHAECAA